MSVSGADLRAAVAATVCGLVDDVLDQLRLVAVRVAAVVHDLDDDLFARAAALHLQRQHATDRMREPREDILTGPSSVP